MIRHPLGPNSGSAVHGVVVVGLTVIVGSIFAAGALNFVLPLRYPLAWLLVAVFVAILSEMNPGRTRTALLLAVPVWTTVVSVYCAVFSPLSPPDNDALFRYVLLFPLGLLVGIALGLSRHRARFGQIFVAWSVVAAILALAEFAFGAHLVPRPGTEGLVRDGFVRAVVAGEHPLVLAMLLVVGLPFLWALRLRWWLTVVISLVLVAGIVATTSRGALGLVVLALVVAMVVRRWPAKSPGRVSLRVLVALGVTAALGFGLALSGFLTVEFLTSPDPETASLQYRLVLYQRMLESLVEHPWGWGIGGLPPGLTIPSRFGPLDISITVDSEVALLAFDAGIVGIAAFAAVLGWLVSRWVLASPFGQVAFLIMVSGFYLAIHAWTGLPLVLMLALGAAFVDARQRSKQLNLTRE